VTANTYARCWHPTCPEAPVPGRRVCAVHIAAAADPRTRRQPRPERPTTGVYRIVRLASMVSGPGERDDNCINYEDCLGIAARNGGSWHCPPVCGERAPVDRAAERDHAAMSRSGWPSAALGGGGWRAPGTGGGEG
jgi:hypothetical protein